MIEAHADANPSSGNAVYFKSFAAVWLVLALIAEPAYSDTGPRVVASIAPVHSLVAGVMAGVGEPTLLVRGYGSPHAYQMRPSDTGALQDAELVFWVGESLETSVANALASLGDGARVVELGAIEELTRLPNRRPGSWGARQERRSGHDPARGHDTVAQQEHSAGRLDMHSWLDVDNAKTMVEVITRELSEHDPARARWYRRNRERLQTGLDDLDEELRGRLYPVQNVPYVVFHDAYQYFERRYGLNAVGALVVGPHRLPSAKRVRALRRQISSSHARCVFREPQFQSALIDTIIEGAGVEVGVLDPLGVGLRPGPNAYFEMMRANADALARCLGR